MWVFLHISINIGTKYIKFISTNINIAFSIPKVKDEIIINLEDAEGKKGESVVFALDLLMEQIGGFKVEITAKSDLGELAQIPMTLFYQSVPMAVFTFNGTAGKWDTRQKKVIIHNKNAVFRLYFAQNGLKAKQIKFTFDKAIDEIEDQLSYVRM